MLQELQLGNQSVVDAMAITRSSYKRSDEKTANIAEEIARNMTTIKNVIRKISENGAMTAETLQELTQANTKFNKAVGQFKM